MVTDLIPLFPTPFLRVSKAIALDQVGALRSRFAPEAAQVNPRSGELTHTTILQPRGDLILEALVE